MTEHLSFRSSLLIFIQYFPMKFLQPASFNMGIVMMQWFVVCVMGINCHVEGLGQTDLLLRNVPGLD